MKKNLKKSFDDNFIKAYEKNLKEIKKKKQQIKEKKISKALDNFEKKSRKNGRKSLKTKRKISNLVLNRKYKTALAGQAKSLIEIE